MEEVPVPYVKSSSPKLNVGVNSDDITVFHDLNLNFPPGPFDEDEELIQILPLNKIQEEVNPYKYSPEVMYPTATVGEEELNLFTHEQENDMRLDEWLLRCAQNDEYVEASPLPHAQQPAEQMNSGYDEQSIVILPDLNRPYMELELYMDFPDNLVITDLFPRGLFFTDLFHTLLD